MTYEEALKFALTVPWKSSSCGEPNCWCEVIEPETQIVDETGEEIYIVKAGRINKIHAHHIVEIHNKILNEKGN